MNEKFFMFILGMMTMFIIMYLLTSTNVYDESGYTGVTIFEKEGTCIGKEQLEVFQVLNPNMV